MNLDKQPLGSVGINPLTHYPLELIICNIFWDISNVCVEMGYTDSMEVNTWLKMDSHL